jgi:hypothetical protein
MPSRGGQREDLKRGSPGECQQTTYFWVLFSLEKFLVLLSLSFSPITAC